MGFPFSISWTIQRRRCGVNGKKFSIYCAFWVSINGRLGPRPSATLFDALSRCPVKTLHLSDPQLSVDCGLWDDEDANELQEMSRGHYVGICGPFSPLWRHLGHGAIW